MPLLETFSGKPHGDGRQVIAEDFVQRATGTDDASRLNNGLTAAFMERVRTSLSPDFAELPLNRDNIVPHATAARSGLHPGLEFGRVLDLSGLFDIYRWALKDRKRYSILKGFTLGEFPLFLDAGLQATGGTPKPPPEQYKFLDDFFTMINDFGNGVDLRTGKVGAPRPFHPVWVTRKPLNRPIRARSPAITRSATQPVLQPFCTMKP
ncbi:MAG: hypothetical protein ABSE86_25300 [Bryobacteraceae bacterium]